MRSIVLFLSIFLFLSCGNDQELKPMIIGTWELTSTKLGGKESSKVLSLADNKLVTSFLTLAKNKGKKQYFDDGHFISSNIKGSSEGTYLIVKDKLIETVNNSKYSYTIGKIDHNFLELSMYSDAFNVDLFFYYSRKIKE